MLEISVSYEPIHDVAAMRCPDSERSLVLRLLCTATAMKPWESRSLHSSSHPHEAGPVLPDDHGICLGTMQPLGTRSGEPGHAREQDQRKGTSNGQAV